MRARHSLLLAAALFLQGCSLVPSVWNPFKTPVEKAEVAEKKLEEAQTKALVAAQESAYKTLAAVTKAEAGNTHALAVALGHSRTSVQLLDQALGYPTVESQRRWQDLIDRQTSLDEKVRTVATEENEKNLKQIGKLSEELQKRDIAANAANERARQYAGELQSFKDSVLKIGWVVGGLFALYFLGQILQFLANLNPAFGTAANVVNAVVSPALHAGFHKARKAAAALVSTDTPSSQAIK
jgi:hypothetical protein